jgi:N-acetylglucosamine-6-phosphate deacetylase
MPGRLLIRNGVLAVPGGPRRADVLCEGERIVAIGRRIEASGAPALDASGLTVGPGFVDIHVHGGGGFSFFSPDPLNLRGYSAWVAAHGVTSFLVSTVGRDDVETRRILEGLLPEIELLDSGSGLPGAEPLGFHLEGPYISPVRAGAFDRSRLRAPSRGEFASYQDAARGRIRQVTIAPELPLALGTTVAIASSGAVPALGHTDASSEQVRAGFETGIRHVTHLFNAMRPLHHRDGGPVAAALLGEAVTCELICDGVHVSPEALRLAYRVLGPSRTVVVTDNIQLAGTGAPTGMFAGREVEVSGGVARRADGTIAGSVATMDQHFRNAVGFLGLDLATAFRLCALNPARIAGEDYRKGLLERGMDADLVLLDSALGVVATVCRGALAHCTQPGRLCAA